MTGKEEIRSWWADNPMTYGDAHGQAVYGEESYQPGAPEFFDRVDKQFYSWNKPLHGEFPFDRLFPYDEYSSGKPVLEVGCGMGTMAMLWAKRGAAMTAVDLNPVAIERTRKRFELQGLKGDIHAEDANRLSFPDASFDYVYSWGVLHHSPDLARSISELFRVARPGAGFGVMLYNRRSLWQWYTINYIEGFLHCENEFLDPLRLSSRYTDGAEAEGNPHTWPVTPNEMLEMFRPYSRDSKIRILGTELDGLFSMMLPGLGLLLPAWAKKPWARRYGWSLWIHGHKNRI